MMLRHSLRCGTACALILPLLTAPTLAAAQTAESPPQPITLGATSGGGSANSPVVIKGVSKGAARKEYATIPQKATYSQSTIGKQQIETASPAATAQTLLNQLPSVVATSAGPNGMRSNVQFRAFNDGQFSETYDHISINDIFNASSVNGASARNNGLVKLDDFDRVQAFRGVNNPAVNSYDSLGGTINYVPREASAKSGGEAGISYGSFNSLAYHIRLNTGAVDGVRQLLSFRRSYSDSWIDYGKDQNNHLYYTMNAPVFGGTGKVYAYFLYNQNRGDTPHTVPLALVNEYGRSYQWSPNQTYSINTDTHYLAILGYSQSFSPIVSSDVKFFFGEDNYMRTSYSNPNMLQGPGMPYQLPNSPADYPFSPNPGATSYDPLTTFGSYAVGNQYHFYGYYTRQIGIQPSMSFNLPHNDITIGGNLTSGHLHSREYWYGSSPVPQIPGYNNAWNEHDLRTYASLYIQDKISLFNDRLHITPGVKYLNAITKDTDQAAFYYPITGSVSNVTHYTSPTVGASFAITPHVTAYASYGQNIRFPSIGAYYNDIGQPINAAGTPGVPPVTVKPEYVKDYETGIRFTRGGFTAAVDYYRENFDNTFISQTNPITGASSTINGGSSLYDGEELQIIEHAGKIGRIPGEWTGFFNYGHNVAKFTSGSDTGKPLANVPQNLISAQLNWTHDNWLVGGTFRFVGQQYLQQGFAGTPTALVEPSYTLFNLVFQKTIPVKLGRVHGLRVAFNLDNLFDTKYYTKDFIYQDNAGSNYQSVLLGRPRTYYLSVSALF